MNKIFWIYERELAGRAGPLRHPWDLRDLRRAGVRVILSAADGLLDPAALASADIQHHCVPLPDDVPPSATTESRCIEALPAIADFIDSSLAQQKGVLVHCFAGKDRTGLILSYFVAYKEGISAADAIRRVRAVQPGALTATGWEELALRVIPQVLSETKSRLARG